MRAAGCFQTPGMSWPREIRPHPMAPMFVRLDGANGPTTDAGTIAGNPETSEAPTAPFPAVARNARLDGPTRRFAVIGIPPFD